jgi:hypothetical protein
MTGTNAETGARESTKAEVQIPKALAQFAQNQSLTFRETLALLEMQNQIIAHRSSVKKGDLEQVDWQKFYEAVKEFL